MPANAGTDPSTARRLESTGALLAWGPSAGMIRQITNSIPAPSTARTGKGACQPNLAMSNPIAGTPAMNAADHASSVIATAVPRFSYATRSPK